VRQKHSRLPPLIAGEPPAFPGCLPLFVTSSMPEPRMIKRLRKTLSIIFVMDVSGSSRLNRPNQNIVPLKNHRHLPGSRQVFARSWLEPTDCTFIAVVSRQMLDWRFQIGVEPPLQFAKRINLVFWYVTIQVICSTKQSRWDVRVLINLSADKTYEHKLTSPSTTGFVESQSMYLFALSVKSLAAGEGVEPSSSSSKPDVLPVTPSRNRSPKSLAAGVWSPSFSLHGWEKARLWSAKQQPY
jgi:hypothetical protein